MSMFAEKSSSSSSSAEETARLLDQLAEPDAVSIRAGHHPLDQTSAGIAQVDVSAPHDDSSCALVPYGSQASLGQSSVEAGTLDTSLKQMLYAGPPTATCPRGPRFQGIWANEVGGRIRKGGDLACVSTDFPAPGHSFCVPPTWSPDANRVTKALRINPTRYKELRDADTVLESHQKGLLVSLGPFLDLTNLLGGSLRPPVAEEVRSLSAMGYALSTNIASITRMRRSNVLDLFPTQWKSLDKEQFATFKSTWVSQPAESALITAEMYTALKSFLDALVDQDRRDREMRKLLPVGGHGKERARSAGAKVTKRPDTSAYRRAGAPVRRNPPKKRAPRDDNRSSSPKRRKQPFRGQAPKANSRFVMGKYNLRQEDSRCCGIGLECLSKQPAGFIGQATSSKPDSTTSRTGRFRPDPGTRREGHSTGGRKQGKHGGITDFSRSEGLRGTSLYPQSEASQSRTSNREVQDGELVDGTRSHGSKLLAGQGGPQGCVLFDSYGRRFETPAGVPLEGKPLPIQPHAQRFEPGTSSVHQAPKACSRALTSPGSDTLRLSGRFPACSTSISRGGSSAAVAAETAPKVTGIHHKRGEILAGAVALCRVPRLRAQLRTYDHNAASVQTATSSGEGIPSVRRERDLIEGSRKSDRITSGCRPSNSSGPASLQVASTVENLVAQADRFSLRGGSTVNEKLGHGTSVVAGIPSRGQASRYQNRECRRDDKGRCAYRHLYRQLAGYVGRFLQRRRRSRSMDRTRTAEAYQRVGAGGRATSPLSLCEQPVRPDPDHPHRQQDCSVLPAQDGGNTMPTSSGNSRTSLGMALRAQPRPELVVHPIAGEQGSRSSVPSTLAQEGVVPEQSSIRIVNIGMGGSYMGPLCELSEHQDRDVLLVGTRPAVTGPKLSVEELSVVEIPAPICLPTRESGIEDNAKACQLQDRETHLDSSGLEVQALVPAAPAASSSSPVITSRPTGPFAGSGGEAPPSTGGSKPESKGMAGYLSRVRSEGFSFKASEYMRLKWRSGSRKTYETYWRGFSRWTAQRDIDPFSASPAQVADYLVHLFHDRDLATSSVGIARSAISCFAKPYKGAPLGEHRRICDLIKAFRNIRPPLARYSATWSIDCLVDYWDLQPENSLLTLKLLTLKVVSLIAISSLSRADEIAHLLRENFAEDESDLAFLLDKRPKNCKTGPIPPVRVVAVPDRPNSCPVICVREYMRHTQEFRERDDSFPREKLLLSLDSRHCAVKVMTISRWIQQAMNLAGIDTSCFKAHSIRGAAASHLASKGLPLGAIMKKGKWKSTSTLRRFYLRDLPR